MFLGLGSVKAFYSLPTIDLYISLYICLVAFIVFLVYFFFYFFFFFFFFVMRLELLEFEGTKSTIKSMGNFTLCHKGNSLANAGYIFLMIL